MAEDSTLALLNMHIKNCDERDINQKEDIREIKDMNKGMWDTIDGMREKIVGLQVRTAYYLGGLMVLGKVFDYFIPHK